MKNKKGFTLVELMVVVAIVAILAAVALPMYSSFKQKGKVSTVLKSLSGSQTALQTWYTDRGSFTDVSVPTTGGALIHNGTTTSKVGAGIPRIPNLTWSGTDTANSLAISWEFDADAGCPSAVCDGTWTIICSQTNDLCTVSAAIGNGSLGLNFDGGTP